MSTMSSRRLLSFTGVAVLLFLGLTELTAAGIERWGLTRARTIPSPAPRPFNSPVDPLLRQIKEDRQRLGLPELRYGGIPLGLGNASEWGMIKGYNQTQEGALYRGDSLGLRGPELEPKRPGEVRLMTLGDSSIFGEGVSEPDVFSSVASAKLSQTWERKVTPVIGAIPGHTTRQSLTVLADVGQKVLPSWVIIGNLWSDVYRRDQHQADLDTMPHDTLRAEFRHFATYRVMHYLLSPWLTSRKVRFVMSEQDIGSLESGPATRTSLTTYVANLRTIADRAATLRARVAFVCLPAPMDLDPAPIPETVRAFRLAMKFEAERLGAPYLDGPALVHEGKIPLAYFRDQVHPAAEAHHVLGEKLAELLAPVGPPPLDQAGY